MISPAETTQTATSAFALTYSNDRGPVGRFPLPQERVIVIGRALESELRLGDGLTSRRHVQVSVENNQIVVEDLESANGTFVNGRKIRRTVVQPGDRMLIGITTFEFVNEYHNSPKTKKLPAVAAPSRNHDSETTIVGTARLMSGSVKEIPLADLLQLLSNTQKSGLLTVKSQRDTGLIYLRDGRICHAVINESSAVQPERTLYRMLRWQTGFFELRPLGTETFATSINAPVDSLLLEAAQQTDELLELERQLPRFDAHLAVPDSFAGEISDLSPTQFDVLQLVHEHGVMLKVVDGFSGSDLAAYQAVFELLQAGFIAAE